MNNTTKFDSNLPEGVLRSTYLPEDTLGGTKLLLSYEKGWYVVHTNWQNLKRSRTLDKAAQVYESILMGTVDVIGGLVCTKK